MKITLGQGVTNPVGKTLDVSWDQFLQLVRSHSVPRKRELDEEKRSAPWFSMVEYRRGHRRRENIAGRVWAIATDLDAVHDARAVERALDRWEYIAWTTWSSTPEEPRWRIVLPIDGGVASDRFGALVDRILDPLKSSAEVDARSRMPEQLWFLPWYRASQKENHRVWRHSGKWISPGIVVNFAGVKLAHKAEEIGEGDRNNMLLLRLGEADALRCQSQSDLREIALEWNDRLKNPLKRKEVLDVVRKKWNWLQRGEGVVRRAEAWRGYVNGIELPRIGVGLTSDAIRTAKLPVPICGDFIYPGATIMSAKMKEGKSFLTMQLALSLAAGVPFLKSEKHPGFPTAHRFKTVIIAGEDTQGGISKRFLGSMAAGHLPSPVKVSDISLVFNDDLDVIREAEKNIPGIILFERLVERWYKEGYRVIAIDPLRVLEGALGIDQYPGVAGMRDIHVRDFQVMRYYTRLAQRYEDLCILVSLHHGKGGRDKDSQDPGDMIAGTTGYGAGAITTISVLPLPTTLDQVFVGDEEYKYREFYVHGRHTQEQRYLIRQDLKTGIWEAVSTVQDSYMNNSRAKYFEALLELGGADRWVKGHLIARECEVKKVTVHHVLRRCLSETYRGYRLSIKKGPMGGYRLFSTGSK